MEICSNRKNGNRIKAVLFDFDGTFSTLRCGWEGVMRKLMLNVLSNGKDDAELEKTVDEYIDYSTGIQTVKQMKWLVKQSLERTGKAKDMWDYKADYNAMLMEMLADKKKALEEGTAKPEEFLVAGSEKLLQSLKDAGIKIFVASGTDHADVVKEAKLLGIDTYFDELCGAPERCEDCSKEKVMAELLENCGYSGEELCVAGDGKVEIALGNKAGALTIGVASDEKNLHGVNAKKRERLIQAGADVIIGDYLELDKILSLMERKNYEVQ